MRATTSAYVRFKAHEAAAECVALSGGVAAWSESERVQRAETHPLPSLESEKALHYGNAGLLGLLAGRERRRLGKIKTECALRTLALYAGRNGMRADGREG